MAAPSRDEILARVRTILRRDLKLGPDAAIPEDMPFTGVDVDLDSLDILLLVTSIEKEFGVKIPSSEVGQEAFQNVGTLVRYVEQHAGDPPSVQAPPASAGSATATLDKLPHRDPFRFVSKLTSVEPGVSAEGTWSVTGAEDFFRGHFPNNPIVPGVLISEALAQVSGLAGASDGGAGMLAHVDVRFEKPVVPPAEIVLRARRISSAGLLEKFDVAASVGGSVVASGSITLYRSS
jgi:3-hydroxyacyl-[acyl-carrier-protein] dehydratase